MRPSPGNTEWALRSRRVVTPSGERDACILVRGETIVDIVPGAVNCRVVDVGQRVVLPGLVDAHVHINEPGRTEWEGFATATRAAAAGGVTTLVDMPLNSSPVTTTIDAFRRKLDAAEGKLWVDCGFYGGIVPGNTHELDGLVAAGVLGFKAFLCHSGIDEFPASGIDDLRAAMPLLAGRPLLAHAEIVTPLPAAVARNLAERPRSYAAYLATRPAEWELAAIGALIGLCREYRSPVHIVHLATADALPMIAAARAEGLPLTVETCPHYLVFAAEEIPDGDTRFKCAPPIREARHRTGLWHGLRSGLIDTIGSDHSPAPPELKKIATGDLAAAWGGIASLQWTLPAVWTAAPAGVTLVDIAQWMCRRPAVLVGLDRKGAIEPGRDADLVVFDPDAEWTAKAEELHHRHKATPYEGRRFRGRITDVYLRGEKADQPRGRPLLGPNLTPEGSQPLAGG